MAASATKMQNSPPASQEKKGPGRPPAKVLTEKEKREAWAARGTNVLRGIERAAKTTETLMKKPGSDAQVEAFRKALSTLMDRLERAGKGEASPGGFSVPTE